MRFDNDTGPSSHQNAGSTSASVVVLCFFAKVWFLLGRRKLSVKTHQHQITCAKKVKHLLAACCLVFSVLCPKMPFVWNASKSHWVEDCTSALFDETKKGTKSLNNWRGKDPTLWITQNKPLLSQWKLFHCIGLPESTKSDSGSTFLLSRIEIGKQCNFEASVNAFAFWDFCNKSGHLDFLFQVTWYRFSAGVLQHWFCRCSIRIFNCFFGILHMFSGWLQAAGCLSWHLYLGVAANISPVCSTSESRTTHQKATPVLSFQIQVKRWGILNPDEWIHIPLYCGALIRNIYWIHQLRLLD